MAWITVTAASQSYSTLTGTAQTWRLSVSTAQSYSTLTGATQAWPPSGLSIEARSRVSAFARFYSSGESTLVPGGVNFNWRVNSAAPWQVATGSPGRIVSSITEGV